MNTILKNTRIKNGMTQLEVAKKSNISLMAYYRYEIGERTPNVHIAQRIAKVLNSTVEELFPLIE